MLHAYLDASALAKRYAPEPGTALVNHLFARLPADRLVVFNVGVAEVVSILVRKRNGGVLKPAAFTQAFHALTAELAIPTPPIRIAADDQLVARAFPFIDRYSVNSTDAIILRSALDLAAQLRPAGHDLVLVTCDRRLATAARAEGLTAFDPEVQSQTDLDALIGP